uniref:Protein FAM43B n=1 Tax=Geotrypetes seraphini TaxID=260995 RepID=A0A6P8P8K3_GEOSA|nr:protein FAM43B [Geotrypetes seraphini]
MLPWKRSKLVLLAEAPARPPKSPGLAYASLLSAFLRRCPDLPRPERCLRRLFRSRRRTLEVTRDEPSYRARYLGNAVTLHAKGYGCTDEALRKIWARSEGGARGADMTLSLGAQGLRLSPREPAARKPGHAYPLRRITYCAADAPRHPRVFAWVFRHQLKNKAVVLRCHAVLLSRPDKANALARLVAHSARTALSDFQRLKRRDDGRRLRAQLLGRAAVPGTPLRAQLKATCPYEPRSAPRLSCIPEEEEEEERPVLDLAHELRRCYVF